MHEVRRSSREFYVIQKYGKTWSSEVIEWRDIYEYSDIRHINEATKILGKLQRGAMYKKTGETFRIIKRTVETIINVENEIIQ